MDQGAVLDEYLITHVDSWAETQLDKDGVRIIGIGSTHRLDSKLE